LFLKLEIVFGLPLFDLVLLVLYVVFVLVPKKKSKKYGASVHKVEFIAECASFAEHYI
jgi:hypothetical protein